MSWVCSLAVTVDGLAYTFSSVASKKAAAEEGVRPPRTIARMTLTSTDTNSWWVSTQAAEAALAALEMQMTAGASVKKGVGAASGQGAAGSDGTDGVSSAGGAGKDGAQHLFGTCRDCGLLAQGDIDAGNAPRARSLLSLCAWRRCRRVRECARCQLTRFGASPISSRG